MKLHSFLMASTLAIGALAVVPASATTFEYSKYGVTNNQNVTINIAATKEVIYGGSGQIVLYGSGSNAGQLLYSWCIDIKDWLLDAGTFTYPSTPTSNGSPTGPALTYEQIGKIGGLIAYGNAHISDNVNISSGTQIAIWMVEYGTVGYTFDGSTGANAVAAALLAATPTPPYAWAPSYAWAALTQTADGKALNQAQGTQTALALSTQVPEPASFALLGFGIAWLAAMRRRRFDRA